MNSSTGSEDENDRLAGDRENADLASATNETSSIIVELSLDHPVHVRWVSQSWQDIAGTDPSSLIGMRVDELVADDDKTLFSTVTDQILQDDSRSVRLRFWLALPTALEDKDSCDSSDCLGALDSVNQTKAREAIEVDANGILIHDRISGVATHTMWVFTIVQESKNWTDGDLDPLLAELLLGGSDFLSTYLQQLACDATLPAPQPLTCNICDRQIQPWFFEKHTALCIVSHKAESEVQDCHDHLRDHRQAIADLLNQAQRSVSQLSYDGIIVQSSVSPSLNRPGTSPQSNSMKQRSSKERKALIRLLELILDYCDLAVDISTPAIPEEDGSNIFVRIQSPDSRNRISQLTQWVRPSMEDPALASLEARTFELVTAKLNAVTRLHNTIHYSEKIRQETDLRVQDLIDATADHACEPTQVELDDNTFNMAGNEHQEDSIEVNNQCSPSLIVQNPSMQQEMLIQGSREDRATSPATIFEGVRHQLAIEEDSGSPSTSITDCSMASEQIPDEKSCNFLAPTTRPFSTIPPIDQEIHPASYSRRNSPQDLDGQIREIRMSRGIYESPRRPSGGSRPPDGFSPSRRASRAVSRTRASSLARERTISPGRRALSSRLHLLERDRLSPSASPTLSATDSLSTETSHKERRVSIAPPLSPRLPSIAPAARPAPPSIKDFDIIKPISKGAFGSVYLSKKRTTGDYYAIKVLKKSDMIAKNQVTNIKAERAIMMAQTESPFIAKLFFTFQSKEYLYLVMEYLNGGDCAALLKQLGGLPEDWTRRYMAEVVLGLEYLHSRGIIHRDLKPDNLLISHNGHLKLTDFGLSRVGLVGRQNRARTSSVPEVPDLLRSNRATSPLSSRSASFDLHSAISTPSIAPMSLSDTKSGYFHLKDHKAWSPTERKDSAYKESDSFSLAMRSLTLDDGRNDSDDTDSTASGRSATQVGRKASDTLSIPTTNSSTTQMPPPAMRLFDPDDGHKKFVGTPDYLAPETIDGSGQDDMVDWWSLGVIMFEFLYGYPPFHAATPDAVFQNILNRQIDWPSATEEEELNISNVAKDLMNRLMVSKPEDRLGSHDGAYDVKRHPFFQGVAWDRISEEEALFVPTPDNPEDTDYFDSRGASNHVFEDDSDQQHSSDASPASTEREPLSSTKDAKFTKKLNTQSRQILKRSIMPLSIPPHVRDRQHRTRRLSESGKDEFGSFTFKNLTVLEKQNLEALRRLRSEHSGSSPVQIPRDQIISAHQRSASTSGSLHVRRTPSLSSSLQSTSTSPPASHPSHLSRSVMPSSPLISSQSGSTISSKTRSGSMVSTATQRTQPVHSPEHDISPSRPIPHSRSLPTEQPSNVGSRNRSLTVGAVSRPEVPFNWTFTKRMSKVFEPDTPSSSSDTETTSGIKALQRVQRRRQRSKRLSSVSLATSSTAQRTYRSLDILICEDNPVSRRVLEAMLAKLKCRVVSVIDGAQAVAAATGDVLFDVIFTDIKVPRLSGVEVARLIRSSSGNNANTPIIAMSSYSSIEYDETSQYFQKRLEKPLTIATISKTLQECLPDWCEPQTSGKSAQASGNKTGKSSKKNPI